LARRAEGGVGGNSARRANRAQNQFGFFQIHTANFQQLAAPACLSADRQDRQALLMEIVSNIFVNSRIFLGREL